jgi:hypothetical protein
VVGWGTPDLLEALHEPRQVCVRREQRSSRREPYG